MDAKYPPEETYDYWRRRPVVINPVGARIPLMIPSDARAVIETCEMEVVAALRQLVFRPTDDFRAEAVRAIDVYVDTMRNGGFKPEEMVIAVKNAAFNAGIARHIDHAQRQMVQNLDLLTEQLVSGAIRRYFEPSILEYRVDALQPA